MTAIKKKFLVIKGGVKIDHKIFPTKYLFVHESSWKFRKNDFLKIMSDRFPDNRSSVRVEKLV